MSDYKDIFRSVESQNWFKCCLAVLITREGILEFVKNEIDTFQQDSLQKVYQVNNVPSGTNCLSCATHCVVPCRPNKSICQIRRGRCTFHTNPQNPCPNKICDNLRQEIEREHHFGAPSWKNTDSKGWCVNSWELAKCFMPPDGYSNISSVEATDFNGIISVMINCKRFENKLDDDLSKDVNLCTKARDVGRSVRHCADLKLSTTTMTQNISTLIDLLGDAKCLKTNAKASEAMTKLIKLKTDSFAISTVDVKAVLDALQTLSQTMGQQLQDLMEEMVKRNKRKMEQIETQHKKKMKLDGAAAISDLKTEIKDEVVAVKKDLETAGAAVMSNLKKEIKDEMGAVKKDLETAGANAVSNLKTEINKEVGTAKTLITNNK